MKKRIQEVIVVEGRYDKNTLLQCVDAKVMTLDGFGVFKDREKVAFLRRLAEKQGLIILTDSDGAGFVIRNYLKGALPRERVKQAYIPDIPGKERRKRTAGKEGKLGVEGMRPEVLLDVLRRAGATFSDENTDADEENVHDRHESQSRPEGICKADLFALGLTGCPDSEARRKALQRHLELPERLSTNGLLDALNLLYTRSELEQEMRKIQQE